ncbi:MAG: LUD domain-containing protein [Verrucomicrobiae bacterium]|nr:LUD domain-containing protein [Verrucomicrobiae bacterium]
MSAREKILERIRQATRISAAAPPEQSQHPIWPPVEDLEATFRREFTDLRGEIVESLPEFLAGFQKIATDRSALAGIGNCSVREAELGVTQCECLVARSGSVVLCCRTAEERALSVLPPVHLVVARRSQIVLDLGAAFELLRNKYREDWPEVIAVISGPSRTADIEKVLVLGAHGPKRLAVHFVGG